MSAHRPDRRWLRGPVLVWLALLLLLALTTWIGYMPLDHLNAAINFPLAGIMVALVAYYLMRLKNEVGVVWLAALAGVIFLFTLFFLTFGDYFDR